MYKIKRINESMVALADDLNLTPEAIKQNTICLENSIADLPEVESLKHTDIVIDVGAFIGDTALIFGECGATVLAFEPQDDAFFCMQYNTMRYDNIICFNEAVGNGEFVELCSETIGGNLGTRAVATSTKGNRSMRLDDLILDEAERVALIKIDCEGFEPNVILGAKELIKKHKPVIVCEVYPELLAKFGYDKNDIYLPLVDMGYSITTSVGEENSVRWDITAKIK